MKNIKNKKNLILSLITFLLLALAAFATTSGCALLQKTLEAPVLNLNSETKELTWETVLNAQSYKIYLNNNLIETVSENATGTPRLNHFDFSKHINNEEVNYKFYLIAAAQNYNNSVKSNEKTYKIVSNIVTLEKSLKINNQSKIVTGATVEEKTLSWNPVKNATEYYIMIFDNANGVNYFTAQTNAIDFSSCIIKNQILAFRVGVKNTNGEVCFSDAVFYNDAATSADYGDDVNVLKKTFETINFFQGKYFDNYLTSQEEMNQMMYYQFVNRIENIELAISRSYYTSLVNKYGKSDYVYLKGSERMNKLGGIGEGTSSFTETCDYSLEFDYDASVLPARHFYVGFGFKFIKDSNNEPTLVQKTSLTQSDLDKGYYQRVAYEKRPSTFDNFVSDNQPLTQVVTTSEQLYFAVENKVTPLFNSQDSSAYKMYAKAKQVLREIVTDNMTEYEKALSIFDWICLNSVYDHKTANSTSTQISFTNYTSFSLEGVLKDSLSVCDGFSKTYSLLCNMEGIDCFRFTGGIDRDGNGVFEGLHAWNKVKVSGNWYVVDITWSVIDTDANDFGQDGATQYNSNEFLNHAYFLVSDGDITEHIVSNKTLDQQCVAPNNYYYYITQTYNGTNNLLIKNKEQLNTLIFWMLENKIYGMDVIVDAKILNGFNDMVKQAKVDTHIEKANILTLANVDAYDQIVPTQYGPDSMQNIGVIYSVGLINLHKLDAA